MQEVNVFEYAIIRVVPRVEREEFLNVGVILFCKKQDFLGVKYFLPEQKLMSLYKEIEVETLAAHLQAYKRIALGEKNAGKLGELDKSDRFRWLTATRSTIIQSSKVHSGLSNDLTKTLEKLYREQVL